MKASITTNPLQLHTAAHMRALVLLASATALDNGVGDLPAMGYNTWNDLRCDGVNADAIVALADRLVDSGLASLGFRYLNVDDCWARATLDADGALVPDPATFPHGLEPVVAHVHARGLKFGIYADRGFRTCAFRPGSKGHEALHARQFAEWGVDYLKHDGCYSPNVSAWRSAPARRRLIPTDAPARSCDAAAPSKIMRRCATR